MTASEDSAQRRTAWRCMSQIHQKAGVAPFFYNEFLTHPDLRKNFNLKVIKHLGWRFVREAARQLKIPKVVHPADLLPRLQKVVAETSKEEGHSCGQMTDMRSLYVACFSPPWEPGDKLPIPGPLFESIGAHMQTCELCRGRFMREVVSQVRFEWPDGWNEKDEDESVTGCLG